MRKLLLIAALLATPGAAQNDELAPFRICASEEDSLERLRCFDAAASGLPPASPEPTGADPLEQLVQDTRNPLPGPNWIVSEEVDPITDRELFAVSMTSSGPSGGRMMIRCTNNGLELLADWGEYLGSDNNNVTIRFGSDEPEEARWMMATNDRVLFAPNPTSVMSRLIVAGKVAIAVRPYRSGTRVAVFEAGDLETHLMRLANCRP